MTYGKTLNCKGNIGVRTLGEFCFLNTDLPSIGWEEGGNRTGQMQQRITKIIASELQPRQWIHC